MVRLIQLFIYLVRLIQLIIYHMTLSSLLRHETRSLITQYHIVQNIATMHQTTKTSTTVSMALLNTQTHNSTYTVGNPNPQVFFKPEFTGQSQDPDQQNLLYVV